MKSYNTDTFIERSEIVHGKGRYSYKKTKYINARTKVLIKCNKCGREFWQLPNSHLRGKGCICNLKHTLEEIIAVCNLKHNRMYDYQLLPQNVKVKDKVKIKCLFCGKYFEQEVSAHMNGHGCPHCVHLKKRINNLVKIFNNFKEKAYKIHDYKYNYDESEYINSQTKIKIKCNMCGYEFYQTPNNHLSGKGCPNCKRIILSKLKTNTLEQFINEANKVHNNEYDYSESNYINNHTPIGIRCKYHGLFYQTPNNHLHGRGCPKCKQSYLEKSISIILDKNNINYNIEKLFNWLINDNDLRLDFYLPDYNIAIECQGGQHFFPVEYFGGEKTFKQTQQRDSEKLKLCKEHGIKLLYFSNLKEYDTFLGEKIYHSPEELLEEIKNSKVLVESAKE